MTWSVTDRITRVNFFAVLVVAAVALWPLLAGQTSLVLMGAVLVLVYQAWRLAMMRYLRVQLDEVGITKTIGTRTRHVGWNEVRSARLGRFLGTDQLVLVTTDANAWSASDRWYGRLGEHELAIQVPAGELPGLRQLLDANGVPLA